MHLAELNNLLAAGQLDIHRTVGQLRHDDRCTPFNQEWPLDHVVVLTLARRQPRMPAAHAQNLCFSLLLITENACVR